MHIHVIFCVWIQPNKPAGDGGEACQVGGCMAVGVFGVRRSVRMTGGLI